MSVNSLLLSGLVFLLAGWVCCYARWRLIDLIDLFVLGGAVFFGIFDVVDSQLTGLPSYDASMLVSSQLQVLGTVLAVRVAGYFIPLPLRKATRIRSLAERANAAGDRPLLAALLACLMFSAYGFYRYGVVGEGILDQLVASRLPYWFTSLKQVEYSGILTGLLVASAVRVLDRSGAARALWLLAAVVSIAMVAVQGRRAVFFCVVILVVIYSTWRQRNVYRPSTLIWLGAVATGLMLVFSNVFQTYRQDLQDIALKGGFAATVSLGEAAADTNRTLSNLEDRQGPWTYQYLVFREESAKGALGGALLQQSVLNVVPRIFQPHKEVENVDDTLERLYSLPSGVDLATNIIGLTFADFGFAGIIVTTMIVTGMVSFVGWVIIKLDRWPFLSVLVFGTAINTLFMIEGSYQTYLGVFRLAGPLAIALALWQLMKNRARFLAGRDALRAVANP